MALTRLSMLARASTGAESAWRELIELYEPLVYSWLRRHSVSHHDALDLTQDVMAAVARELADFEHNGNPGAFRAWLRQITANRVRGFWRRGRLRPDGTGRSSIREMFEQLADPASSISKQWDRAHDTHVLNTLLDELEGTIEPNTLSAFRRLVFDGEPADEVAAELQMSVGSVYSAKSRVLRRLRSDASRFFDESGFS